VADRIVASRISKLNRPRPHYGVNIRDVQDLIEIAIGGMNIMESVEGRERYPIRVRYLREYREDIRNWKDSRTRPWRAIPAQVVTIKASREIRRRLSSAT
jgi:Cu/Ag efflux pump CusA